jgi:hypothetical protein
MDPIVLAAMNKWPNVPAVFGWLRLDARGGWWLRGQRLQHPAICAFFDRNYAADSAGRYYVQNGPQRVYVSLDKAPYVARRHAAGWSLSPGGREGAARCAWLTPEGDVLLDVDGELALVDDRDLAAWVELAMPDWDGDPAAMPTELPQPEGPVRFASAELADLHRRFSLTPEPMA